MMFAESERKRYASQAGFSLIEAMVAIAIFSIGILGAYKMQLHATQSAALANRVSTSTSWAAYAVEEILGKNYNHVDLIDNGNTDNVINGTNLPNNKLGWAGLDDSTSNADGQLHILSDGSTRETATGNDPRYSIYWNIAEGGDPSDLEDWQTDKVLIDTKLIRVHVWRNGGIGNGHLYSHDYFKTLYPE